MDKKAGELKAENYSMANTAFSDQIPAAFSLFETPSSLSFMDLFGCQDYSMASDIYDFLQPPTLPPPVPLMPPPPVLSPATTVPESSEVVNTPATPNSTSISSSFTDALNDDQQSKRVEGDADEKTPKKSKQLKPKKKEKMKVKQPRFAFMTKSEVDHLDDGYRWRKYGQKAVKNSPFPRSYYRCTSSQCNVKKRVERSCEDHAVVVTTYEGTHIHPCPITCRGTFGIVSSAETTTSSLLGVANNISGFTGGSSYLSAMQYQHRHQTEQQQYFSKEPPPTLNSSNIVTSSSLSSHIVYQDQERRFSPRSACFFTDGGLLQDIVTSKILKEPKEE